MNPSPSIVLGVSWALSETFKAACCRSPGAFVRDEVPERTLGSWSLRGWCGRTKTHLQDTKLEETLRVLLIKLNRAQSVCYKSRRSVLCRKHSFSRV